ncbi:MAG: acyl-CoA dehydrogenase [Rhodospirillales bacterium 69-11]|nr:acyl-CoA dehydrogenase family protein [Rhodospirillales bacterium]OJW21759.1 MAG: acyl-CoA dehydrogenase [Rhodospirillales bacterium 69-11]
MATPMFRFDPMTLPPEAEALRGEVRAFIADHADAMSFSRSGFDRDFSRAMGRKGWIGMTWPKQYGGQERSALERYVLIEEMLAAGAPLSAHYISDRQSGPNILRFGTEEQKRHFLPRIVAGELTFCIGMSEPNSGSDLAGTRTRAVKVDGGYRINGTKLWTSNAHRSDYAILFCKMAQPGEEEVDRHGGATQFLLDLKSPGIEIRPVIDLLGEHHFNEIFLTDVFVPDWLLLGKEGNGWNQVTSELAFERSAPDRFLALFQMLREMVRLAGPDPDRATAAALGKLVAQLATLRSMSLSIAGMLQEGLQPNTESAVVKDLGTRYEQDIPVVARQLFPTEPELEAVETYVSMIARSTMSAPRLSIQGGTREILRGIIARGLGLR